jgi:hypothetical protein
MVDTVASIFFETSDSTSSGVLPSNVVMVTTNGKLISGNKVSGNLVIENSPKTMTIRMPIRTVMGFLTL